MDLEIYKYEERCPVCENENIECAFETPDKAKFYCKKCDLNFDIKRIWIVTHVEGEEVTE